MVVFQGNIDGRPPILILVKHRIFRSKVLLVVLSKQFFDGPIVEGQEPNHAFDAELQKDLEENGWRRLILDQDHNFTLSLASVNTLQQQQFSQSYLEDLYSENIRELSVTVRIFVLLLDADLPVVVKLESKQQVVSALYLQVVARSERVDHSALPIFVLYYP